MREEKRSHRDVVAASSEEAQVMASRLMLVLNEHHVVAHGAELECQAAKEEAGQRERAASQVAADKSRLQQAVWSWERELDELMTEFRKHQEKCP
mgnify:CR=1 FL=1